MSNLPDLYLDIALDGVVLYDTNDFMAGRWRLLSELIRRNPLHREKEGRDLIWRWREPPGTDRSLEWEEVP